MTAALLCSRRRRAIALLAIIGAVSGAPRAWAQTAQPTGTGRVVATITTLEGNVRMPGVDVDLRTAPDMTVIAQTTTDAAGQVTFADVPPGRYVVHTAREGFFTSESAPFEVRSGESAQVLLDIRLTFVLPTEEVRAPAPATPSPSPTDSVQPVSMSDLLSGSVLELTPLQGDDFQSLLPLLPGVVRGSDGRLRIKGGNPTQGALQVSSASLIDPSTGDFDLELPGQSIDTVEVLANPFAAEYGRFTTSVTQIRTRRGTNEWEFKPGNLMPRLRSGFRIRGFEPRFSVRGPLKTDRAFFAEDVQFRYLLTPVKSLPDEPDIELRSFDAFTRIDTVLSARHIFGGGIVVFPREVEHATMNTFRPPEVAPDFDQNGASLGIVDRLAFASDVVLETTVATRWFEVEIGGNGSGPMTYAPPTQSGTFFNDQERKVRSTQIVEALSATRNWWRGQHVVKIGIDLQRSWFEGTSFSHPLEIRRLDGSLAERTEFSGPTDQEIYGTEWALFAQDRWRIGSRVTLELGIRSDRDGIVEHINYSPRAGVAIGVLPEGRAILRGGYGKFVQRTPLNVDAFERYESRVVSRFDPNGAPLGPPVAFRNDLHEDLHTPEAQVGNVEWDQRFGRRMLLKAAFLRRSGAHEYILVPEPAAGRLFVTTTGESRYKELELTARYLGGARRDLTFSYVWAKGTADLNNYDQFFGNFRTPIIRQNEYGLIPTDVRHRFIARGTIGFPGKWDFAPVVEVRSGFPWSAVNEFQDFVGPRNTAGRLPTVRTFDFSLSRPWQFKKYRFRAGVKVYNTFGSSSARDVQNNITSPDYGSFYNPLERSIGVMLGSAR